MAGVARLARPDMRLSGKLWSRQSTVDSTSFVAAFEFVCCALLEWYDLDAAIGEQQS